MDFFLETLKLSTKRIAADFDSVFNSVGYFVV